MTLVTASTDIRSTADINQSQLHSVYTGRSVTVTHDHSVTQALIQSQPRHKISANIRFSIRYSYLTRSTKLLLINFGKCPFSILYSWRRSQQSYSKATLLTLTLPLTLSLTRNYRPSRHCCGYPPTTDWHCLNNLQEYPMLKRTFAATLLTLTLPLTNPIHNPIPNLQL